MELGNWKSSTALPESQARAVLGIANGWTSKEIARMFGISPGTVDNKLNVLKERLHGNYDNTGKRGWVVAECIRRGWISPLIVLVFIGSIVTSIAADSQIDMRRTSNRLSGRSVASRMVRGRKTREAIDFEFSDMTPELLVAFFEAHPDENTLAPWSSVALAKDGPLSNDQRLSQWRSLIAA